MASEFRTIPEKTRCAVIDLQKIIIITYYFIFIFSALRNVWYTSIMNSADEVVDVGNLPERQSINASDCGGGVLGIQGSSNLPPIANFNFSDAYIPNFSGMLYDTVTQHFGLQAAIKMQCLIQHILLIASFIQ